MESHQPMHLSMKHNTYHNLTLLPPDKENRPSLTMIAKAYHAVGN